MKANREFMRQIDRALTALALDWPFWASIGLTMEREITDEVPIACTDGKTISFNPEGFSAFGDDAQRAFVLLHEVSHVILKHPILKVEMRMRLAEQYDEELFQMAADYVINGMLAEAKVPPPPSVLLDHQYRDMSVEEVYMKLYQQKQKRKPPKNSTPPPGKRGQSGAGSPPGGSSSSSPSAQHPEDQAPNFKGDYGQVKELALDKNETKDSYEADLNQRLVQAESIAKAAGMMPGNFMSRIDVMIRPRLDWRNVLSQVLFNQVPFEYTYKHPNKVFLQDDIIMPTVTMGEGGDVVFAVDTSGSITDADLQAMLGQLNSLRTAFPNITIHVIHCDTEIHKVIVVHPRQPIDDKIAEAEGRGGTVFDPVFRWVHDKLPLAKAVVYLTDGWPFHAPDMSGVDCPVIWVLTADNDHWRKQCPRGEITLLDA